MSNLVNSNHVKATVLQGHSDGTVEGGMEAECLDAEVQASINDPDPGVPHDEAMHQIRAAVFAD